MRGYIEPFGNPFDVSDLVSGMVTSGDLAFGVVFSGNIASGQIGGMHLSSGAVQSGHIGNQAATSGNIASGCIGSVHIQDGTIISVDIASGAVQSGQIGSGAVLGQAGGGAFCIASGTITTNDIGSGAIISGLIGSGQIGNFHIASGQVQGLAGAGVPNIASGTVNAFNLGSGSVGSGHIGSGAVWGLVGSLPHILSGTLTGFELGSGSVVSGRIGSGQVGNFHNASGQIQGLAGAGVPNIASGTINNFNLGSGSVLSGHVGSGTIYGLVGSLPHISSGTFTGFELGSGAVVSGRVASGQIGFGHLANQSILSGTVGSGQIASGHLASGLISNLGISGYYDDTFTAAEPISGAGTSVAVAFTQSGTVQAAMASISGRMPAVGIVTSNFLSGATVTFYWGGRVFASGGFINFSGWMNRPVYVGRSGQLSASGAPTSSGDIQQIVGYSFQQSGIFLNAGDPLEQAIAASGDIGSGAVYGTAAAGYFTIASGSIAAVDVASGCHVRTSMQAGGQPMVSGTATMLPVIVQITAENVSGNCAVCASPSGTIRVAMAATSGRYPAIGVALGNALSGTTVIWAALGSLQFLSGMADYSGYVGQRVWLGRSGNITTISGSWSSGGFASGDVGQPLGVIANSGGIWFNVQPVMWSGGPLGISVGGPY